MMGVRFEPLVGFSSFSLFGSLEISRTIAWFKQPSATSLPPCWWISASSALPAASMKLTPQRFILRLSPDELSRKSFQLCSKAETQGPASLPFTVRLILPGFCSVVMRSMACPCATQVHGTHQCRLNFVNGYL